MSNENRDKAAWKNRLEDPAILGLTSSDTNALWEKLDGRLHEKPRRKRLVWYWAAAACLLLVILLPFIKSNRTPNAVDTTAVVKQAPVAPVVNENITQAVSPPAENTGVVVEKRQAIKVIKEEKIKAPALVNVANETVSTSTPPIVQQAIEPVQHNLTPIANTPVTIAAAGPVLKQKLKVVHINELGYPEQPTHRDDHIADYRSIRFNPVSPQTYTTTSPTQNANDFNFFKTKTSPSN